MKELSETPATSTVELDRRVVLTLGAASLLGALAPQKLFAEQKVSHGLSIFGDLKYGGDFSHFDYVNPDAPKGGTFSTSSATTTIHQAAPSNQSSFTFNTFNMMVLKGDSPAYVDIIFDSLMVQSHDEPDAVYGLVAESVEKTDGGQTLIFNLRKEARFHDGSALTADDVAFSLTMLKEKGHPLLARPLEDMEEAIAEEPQRLRVRLKEGFSRSVPTFVATMPIVSKAYFETHDYMKSNFDKPLSSGPYKIGRYKKDQFVEYDRVKDYWAKDLPVTIGRYNFDTVRLEYYRERAVGFEAFKAGKYRFREEFTSRRWAKDYDFPAVQDGRVKREVLSDETPSGTQGWFLNTRRPQLADKRVREAIGLAFDFEWSNRTLFFGAYNRTNSYFENSPMMAVGEPSPSEIRLLEEFKSSLPEEIFGPVYTAPQSDGSGRDRKLFRKAIELLSEAGWNFDGNLLKNASGETLKLEFLDNNTAFQHVIGPYVENLKRIGIDASVRIVDPSQYQLRVKDFDYDVISTRFSMSLTPGVSLRQLYSSTAADQSGSYNLSGVKDPVIDALLEKIIEAPNREDLDVATRVLDRVLRANHYWVPHWNKAAHTVAYWDIYDHPPTKASYHRSVITTWWHDAQKAKKLAIE